MGLVYLFVALFATLLGSLAGIGGGIIIKPVLDFIGDYDAFVIGILSSATIFSMALVSTARRYKQIAGCSKVLLVLAISSIAGGMLGNAVFNSLFKLIDASTLQIIQSSLIIILLSIVLLKGKIKRYYINNYIIVSLTGIVLGALSAFLGIGGGPINVAILCILFSMNIKEAAIGSIFIILLSQFGKLMTVLLTTGFGNNDYSMLFYMIPAAIASGFLGSYLNKKLSARTINSIFITTVIIVIIINLYNGINAVI